MPLSHSLLIEWAPNAIHNILQLHINKFTKDIVQSLGVEKAETCSTVIQSLLPQTPL